MFCFVLFPLFARLLQMRSEQKKQNKKSKQDPNTTEWGGVPGVRTVMARRSSIIIIIIIAIVIIMITKMIIIIIIIRPYYCLLETRLGIKGLEIRSGEGAV